MSRHFYRCPNVIELSAIRFMYIKNHGVPQELVDEMFEVSAEYHHLPLEDRMADYVYESETLRGYDIHYTNTPNGPKRKPLTLLTKMLSILITPRQRRKEHFYIATTAIRIQSHLI
jgi:isopenicillin N synthase-like dioxygenase